MAGYILPVGDVRKSTYIAHTRRNPPSQEAGVDYYCPIGTPILCADNGVVVDIGRSIIPATGYFVTVDLDDGRRVRYLHLSSIGVKLNQRVGRGERIALSGATGYGEADWSWNVAGTGGAHVHVTLWPRHAYRFGVNSGTMDFHSYADIAAVVAGNESEEMPLNEADKDWVRSAVRQEIGGALAGFAEDYAKMVAGEPLSEENKKWVREQTRQEIGGALSGFTDSIAEAVAAKLGK